MYTIEPETIEREPEADPTRRWLLPAAAVLVALAIGALLVTVRGDGPDQPAPADVPAPPTREETAVTNAQRVQEAILAGDVDTVAEMSNPEFALESDRARWEMHAVLAQHQPSTVQSCSVSDDTRTLWVTVECVVEASDPVWIELGVAHHVWPWRVFDDGTTSWQPILDDAYHEPNVAVADYLREFRSDEFEAVCDPVGYDPGTIAVDGGLALTAQCAEVWAPISADIAQWIADGRPTRND